MTYLKRITCQFADCQLSDEAGPTYALTPEAVDVLNSIAPLLGVEIGDVQQAFERLFEMAAGKKKRFYARRQGGHYIEEMALSAFDLAVLLDKDINFSFVDSDWPFAFSTGVMCGTGWQFYTRGATKVSPVELQNIEFMEN